MCESDNKPGLTVDEVRNCENNEDELIAHAAYLLPMSYDLEKADLNGDGVLLFKE